MTTDTKEDIPEKQDFYQRLREKVRNWFEEKGGKSHKFAEFILAAPDLFHLLVKLSVDSEVSTKSKTKIGLAITYFVSPIDLMPEAFLGPAGYADDVAVAAKVLDMVVNQEGEEVVRRHWAGDRDILGLIQSILSVVDELVGAGLWNKVKGFVGL